MLIFNCSSFSLILILKHIWKLIQCFLDIKKVKTERRDEQQVTYIRKNRSKNVTKKEMVECLIVLNTKMRNNKLKIKNYSKKNKFQ